MENTEPTNENTPVPAQADETPTPRPRHKREKTRSLEELHDVSPRTMSDPEKGKYIQALREINNELEGKVTQYRENAESAYKKCEVIERTYSEQLNTLEQRIVFIKQNAKVFAKTIIDLA